ncbi:hypothetical protein I7I53_07185 [Histoplasma capsulatum var. duboisii H88]|uniref:Uncharacterized protein n=1 Tax=Ajellomyces capsulatus (strain H88) TaxID=544711 RepID=A0A8A1LH39_AJEC8|nr:hypothetical protein I7I53_07185 [Histoplasma capsulatum var. duboisii H88]
MYSTYTVQAMFSDLKRIILFCFIRLWPVLSTDYPVLLQLMVGGGRSRVTIDPGMPRNTNTRARTRAPVQ